jgi:hypothetical protein
VAGRGRGLWTPQGEVPLAEKDVQFLTQHQLVMLSFLHEWAYKFQLTITCKRCNSAVVGRNSDADIKAGKHASVACQCTEWLYDPARAPKA